jgi:nucleoside-diphosphate-sugar epimerase
LFNFGSAKRKYDLGWYPRMSATDAIALACDWYKKGSVGEDCAEMIEEQIK